MVLSYVLDHKILFQQEGQSYLASCNWNRKFHKQQNQNLSITYVFPHTKTHQLYFTVVYHTSANILKTQVLISRFSLPADYFMESIWEMDLLMQLAHSMSKWNMISLRLEVGWKLFTYRWVISVGLFHYSAVVHYSPPISCSMWYM